MFLLGLCLFLGALVGVNSREVKFVKIGNFSEEGKIVGGNYASEGQFPYQVSIQFDDLFATYHFCGGTIYSRLSIITAAHCCRGDYTPEQIEAGEDNLLSISDNEQVVEVSELFVHPDYYVDSKGYPHNDICIIRLKDKLSLDNFVGTLPIDKGGNCEVNSQCTISGWGSTYSGGSGTSLLKYATIPILKDSDCIKYGKGFNSTEMICAGYVSGGIDTCQGDSGGPLACNNVLCGVVSFGQGCAQIGYPGVYTKVATYAEWIEINSSVKSSGFHVLLILAFAFITKHLF